MATVASSFRLATKCRQCRTVSRTLGHEALGRWRMFATSPSRLAADDEDFEMIAKKCAELKEKLSELGASDSIEYDGEIKPWSHDHSRDYDLRGLGADAELDQLTQNSLSSFPLKNMNNREKPVLAVSKKRLDELREEQDMEGDVSGMAHAELEQHREFRHYARLIAWEMPLLTKMAKSFEPPTIKQVLRFRYTTYMGEQHPAEKKVVVEFCPQDMPNLTPMQTEKLKKLVGPRYNPETDIIKMSCEMFETQAQNKRYLGDLVDTLLKEARDPTDTFEDIPLDTRHHPLKVKPKFPFEWRMTPTRQAELEASRQKASIADEARSRQGTLVNGVTSIRTALKIQAAEAVPEMIKAPKGRGKTLSVRR